MFATPTKADECVQIENKKRHVTKGKSVSQKVAGKSKTDHSDKSAIFYRVKENGSSEPRTRFEHDVVLIKDLLN